MGQRTFYICAASDSEMNQWVTALRSVCNAANITTTKPQPLQQQQSTPTANNKAPEKDDTKVGLDDFEIKKVVGKGSFGKAWLSSFGMSKDSFINT